MNDSYFDGTFLQWLGWSLAVVAITLITGGLGYPWACCLFMEWETSHTIVNGKRLKFTGTGLELFKKYIVWFLLTFVTLGIYGFWMWIKVKRWTVEHTVFEYPSMDYQQAPVVQQQVNVAPQECASKKYVSNDDASVLSGPAPLILGIVISMVGIVYIAKSWAGLGIALLGILILIVGYLNQK
ncbi:DUF898 family protein [Dysosmobacter welbionis]|uniref:DUF898 family protein n=1 Tax=Dysosmobacter welbionis TaxID=2093857 RepID=UPI003AF8E2C0